MWVLPREEISWALSMRSGHKRLMGNPVCREGSTLLDVCFLALEFD